MTVVRWKPLRTIAEMEEFVDRLFDNAWRTIYGNYDNGTNTPYTFPLDVYETDEAFMIAADLPGVNADDIDITLHDDLLTISAEVPNIEVKDNTRVHMRERLFGKFSRSLRIPQNAIDVDKVQSAYENGVLKLMLPKAPEAQPRRIPVTVANQLEDKSSKK